MLRLYKYQIRPEMECRSRAWSVLAWSLEFKLSTRSWKGRIYSPLCSLFPHRHKVASLSLLYYYPDGKFLNEFLLAWPVQTFTARTLHTTFKDSNHTHFLCVLNVRSKFPLSPQNTSFFPLSQGSIIIYPHNFPFLPSSLSFV